MSLWSSEVISRTKQLPAPAGKREILKLYHSPWVPLGCQGGRPTRKQMLSALRQQVYYEMQIKLLLLLEIVYEKGVKAQTEISDPLGA